jgi:decaprenylphospho-beta-D-erythro-pentofuranosid-2-ulose 2-reductase
MRDGVGRIGTVLVFGGTSDIGRAAAAELLRDGGGTAILAGRRPAALEDAARRLSGPRRTILTLAYDAAEPASADRVLCQAVAAAGDLDVVLVCLGALGERDRLNTDPVATEQSLQINMLAPAVASHAVARRLAAQGHGVLVVLSSVAALRPRRDILTYSAAKAGLDAYTRGLGEMVAGTGARVMVVRPGQVRTRMTAGRPDVPFTVDATAVARAISHGVRTGARVVYVPAVLRWVMAGLRALPVPVFRRLTAIRPPHTGPAAAGDGAVAGAAPSGSEHPLDRR